MVDIYFCLMFVIWCNNWIRGISQENTLLIWKFKDWFIWTNNVLMTQTPCSTWLPSDWHMTSLSENCFVLTIHRLVLILIPVLETILGMVVEYRVVFWFQFCSRWHSVQWSWICCDVCKTVSLYRLSPW
jgi:hypothetical protein